MTCAAELCPDPTDAFERLSPKKYGLFRICGAAGGSGVSRFCQRVHLNGYFENCCINNFLRPLMANVNWLATRSANHSQVLLPFLPVWVDCVAYVNYVKLSFSWILVNSLPDTFLFIYLFIMFKAPTTKVKVLLIFNFFILFLSLEIFIGIIFFFRTSSLIYSISVIITSYFLF